MNDSKENLMTIVILIVIVVLVVGIAFVLKIFVIDTNNSNDETVSLEVNNTVVQKSTTEAENTDTENEVDEDSKVTLAVQNYINMKKYYIDSEIGEPATAYNEMLDNLGMQAYIAYSDYTIYNDGTITESYRQMDLIKCIRKESGYDSDGKWKKYVTWRGLSETGYLIYTEKSDEWEKETDTYFNEADAMYYFLSTDFLIVYDEDYDYTYEENVTKDGNVYNKFTAISNGNGNYTFGDSYYEEESEFNIYLDVDSLLPIESELISATSINGEFWFSYDETFEFNYEYEELSLPEELLDL